MAILRKKMRITPTRQKTIILTGGLNEALSNLELKPGNLTECVNYVEEDGISHGYTSYPGYERYDGTALASSVGITQDSDGVVTDDTAREARRTAIDPLPGEDKVLGVAVYKSDVYGWRNGANPATTADMFKATGSGWGSAINGGIFTHTIDTPYIVGETITGTATGATGTVLEIVDTTHMYITVTSPSTAFSATEATTGDTAGVCTLTAISLSQFNRDGKVKLSLGRFSEYNTNQEIMTIVDGVSDPHIFYDDILIPLVAATGALPSTYPTHCGIWKNRLFLAYPGGHLLFSEVADPTKWDAAANAGEIYVGEDITDIVVAPGGALIITTLNKIRIIKYETAPDATAFLFSMDDFSDTSGSIEGTMKRMLGTMYFCDDRGITTLQAVQEFGDFAANALSKKVETSYQSLKVFASVAMVDREKNQYTAWFNKSSNESFGLVFTFSNKRLRGAGVAKFPTSVECIADGKTTDRDQLIYFGDGDGYIQKMNSGSSFDGAAIVTRGATTFYNYGSPNTWKHFRRLTFEVSATNFTTINYRMDFDYKNSKMPAAETQSNSISTVSGVWGAGVWGTFSWGDNYLNQVKLRALGYGGNMRVLFTTSSKYRSPHTIHNIITEYSIGSTQIT